MRACDGGSACDDGSFDYVDEERCNAFAGDLELHRFAVRDDGDPLVAPYLRKRIAALHR